MNKVLENILTSRDSTIGHYRFAGHLIDGSDNSNNLMAVGINASDYISGFTENGITALELTAAKYMTSDSADFNFGTDSFSVEFWIKHEAASGIYLTKYDSGADQGWAVSFALGRPAIYIADSVANASGLGNSSINDNRWHYLAVTVDRANGIAKIFIDGSQDSVGDIDISAVTGSLNSSELMTAFSTFVGQADELAIHAEVLTENVIADRFVGRMVEPEYDESFILNFLPAINSGNENLVEFLQPSTKTYLDMKFEGGQLSELYDPARCPAKLLTHLASMSNFELIDPPYATEAERRRLLKWVPWIYSRRGTILAVEKIVELLGFAATITEIFSPKYPMISNQHRIYNLDLVRQILFEDDFEGNLSKWGPPLNSGSWFRIQSGWLYGTGNGADDDSNGILFDDDSEVFYAKIDFELIDAADLTTYQFGLYLKYQDVNNWVRLSIYRIAGGYYLILNKKIAGVNTFVNKNITGIISISGIHKLWIHSDFGSDIFTFGIDEYTFGFEESFDTSAIPVGKKGILVNRAITVAFNDLSINQLNKNEIARIYDSSYENRAINILITTYPVDSLGKFEYMKRVVPKYLPVGIEITWT